MKDKTLKWILATIGVLNIIDYISTIVAISNGVAEGNAAMDAIIGTALFPIVKLVLVPAGLFLIWHVRHNIRRPVMYFTAIPFAAYSLLTAWHIYGQFIM